MKKVFLLLIVQGFLFNAAFAQAGRDETLANSYMQNGELDKAAELFQCLWEKNYYDLKF